MPSRSGSLKVSGLREFVRACDRSDKAVKKELRNRLRAAGRIVQEEASRLFSRIYPPSAAGFGTSVRQRGVSVEQRKGTVTGQRPDFGALQMRYLLKARSAKFDDVEGELEHVLDVIDL